MLFRRHNLLALLALGVVSVCLAACGSSGGSEEAANASSHKVNHGDLPLPKKGTYAEEHPGQAKYGSPPLEFEADPSGKLAYTANKVMAKEGNVTIEFTNPQSTPQNIAVEALPSHGRVVTETIQEGFTALAVTINAKEKFVFYSTLPGHQKAGMKGVIKVTPVKP